jgi:hypothetical protein
MKYIIFINGYRSTESIRGVSGKQYLFRKKFVTAVDDEDSEGILNKTSRYFADGQIAMQTNTYKHIY